MLGNKCELSCCLYSLNIFCHSVSSAVLIGLCYLRPILSCGYSKKVFYLCQTLLCIYFGVITRVKVLPHYARGVFI